MVFAAAFLEVFEGTVLGDFSGAFLGAFLAAAVFLLFFFGVAAALEAFFPADLPADVFAEDVLEAEALVLGDIREVFPLGGSNRSGETALFVRSVGQKEGKHYKKSAFCQVNGFAQSLNVRKGLTVRSSFWFRFMTLTF